jgi:chorismate mutase
MYSEKLKKLRLKIDQEDKQIKEALLRRSNLTAKIVNLKQTHNVEFRDPDREESLTWLKGTTLSEAENNLLINVYQQILKHSHIQWENSKADR